MRPQSAIFRFISFLLILAILNLNFSCHYYKYSLEDNHSAEKIDQLKNSPNYIIIHQSDQAFHLSRVKVDVDQQKMTGILEYLPEEHQKYLETAPEEGAANRFRKRSPDPSENTPQVINEVHFYVKDIELREGSEIEIPVASIEKIEVYDKHVGATTASWVVSSVLITFGVFMIIFIIILLTKSSCPFLYIENGEEYSFLGEIYSGAIFKGLERDDYIVLPTVDTETLNIKIANKLKEIQYLNQVGMIQVTHPELTEVIPDKNGDIHLIESRRDVLKATVGDKDITPLLFEKDSTLFTFNQQYREDFFNEINLTLPASKVHKEGHLILHAKNSLWGDYVFGEFTKLFGSSYTRWIGNQNEKPPSEVGAWSVDQGLAMKVFIKHDNQWTLIDTVDLVGPLAFRDLVVPIDMTEIKGDIVEVRLTAGYMMWDLDYVGIGYGDDSKIELNYTKPLSAFDNGAIDVLSDIYFADDNYLVQRKIGDDVTISFPLIQSKEGFNNSYILHSRGYYNHVRDYTWAPQITSLLEFKTEGRFSQYSKEKADQLNGLMQEAELSASSK